MIHLHITLELVADEYGPHEIYEERLVLPLSFARDALEAHGKLITLLATEEYFELPRLGGAGLIPANSGTVRSVSAWDG